MTKKTNSTRVKEPAVAEKEKLAMIDAVQKITKKIKKEETNPLGLNVLAAKNSLNMQ